MRKVAVYVFLFIFICQINYSLLFGIDGVVNTGKEEGKKWFKDGKKKVEEAAVGVAEKGVDKMHEEIKCHLPEGCPSENVPPNPVQTANVVPPSPVQSVSAPSDDNHDTHHPKSSSESEEEPESEEFQPDTAKIPTPPSENPIESKGISNHASSILIFFTLVFFAMF